MHDHWSQKVILWKNVFFSENTQKKEKGGDHGVHQGDI